MEYRKRSMQAILGMALAAAIISAPVEGRASAIGSDDQLLSTVSELKGLKFTLLDKLPAAPAKSGDTQACAASIVQPTTKAGRLVAARGWSVTGEAKVGLFEAVSFASHFEDGTSGTCQISDGNVGLFGDGRLVALAYAEPGSKRTIGHIAGLDNGTSRIWDGEFLSVPFGEIVLTDDSQLILRQLPKEDVLCGGKAVVPNIVNMPIDKARAALAAKGWKPVPGDASARPADFGAETDLVKKGIVEVESCSGTGMAYCTFNYSAAGGTLSVTTAGEDDFPEVVNYEATCQ